ncbi:MAG: PKD domain-containing protein [Microthrixaceae bacterium]
MPRSHVARRRAGQGGFTLLELLLVLGISGLLIGPIAAWTILVMRQNPVQRDGMLATAQADLVRAYFPEDVAVAGAADDYKGSQPSDARWNTWRNQCDSADTVGGRPLAVLITQSYEPVKIIYSVAPTRDGDSVVPGESSLWRSECKADTGELLNEDQLIERVVDDPTRTTATCTSAPLANGDPDKPCRQIKLRITTDEREGRLELSATRRLDARSLDIVEAGNFLPQASIREVTRTFVGSGSAAVQVRFTAADSTDVEDGSNLSYAWELPSAPASVGGPLQTASTVEVTHTFPVTGVYWVRLTVTDSAGGSRQSYAKVELKNRNPVVVLNVNPAAAVAEQTTLNLSAAGSSDPDGSITSYRWRLTNASAGPNVAEFTDAAPTFPVPRWAIGTLLVELTVTDNEGATATLTSSVQVADPADPNPGPGPGPDPGDPGAPIAGFSGSHLGDTTMSLDASESFGNIVAWSWDLGLLAGTATGRQISPEFPGPGQYTVVLTVVDDQNRSASTTRLVIVPGQIAAPDNARLSGSTLVWDPRPGARRYLVDMESAGTGCSHSVLNQDVAASTSPSWPLLSAMCPGGTARVRVGAEGAAGSPVAWTGWIDVTGVTP